VEANYYKAPLLESSSPALVSSPAELGVGSLNRVLTPTLTLATNTVMAPPSGLDGR